ncbi:MAG: nucleotide sugar dehydrogenase [Alphaproteobacteria bacterium]
MSIGADRSSAVDCEISLQDRIAVIGMGYVGLPLALEFGKMRAVIGFDIDAGRIEQLQHGVDRTLEVTEIELANALHLTFSSDTADLDNCKIYIVTVPTPIDPANKPDLSALRSASAIVARTLKPGNFVIYESTVYPGATEQDCVPVLEAGSGLKLNEDFFVGYSPERINPGDKQHRLPNICKVTSGSTEKAADEIDALYKTIIAAGTHKAPSIQVAEAAKVIENTQRDLNIALVNELAILFNHLNIDTHDVLTAAGTKWNFLPFQPGLVGGHCIGVDPYYLTYRARQVGYIPKIIQAGRDLNDSMAGYVAKQLVDTLISKSKDVKQCRALICGFTFKENCPDIRNTKVADLVAELANFGLVIDIYDPVVDGQDVLHNYGYTVLDELSNQPYDAVVLAVKHSGFVENIDNILAHTTNQDTIIYDLKHLLPNKRSTLRL